MSRIHRHLSFANVVSVIALCVALGGTAIASVIVTNNNQVAPNTISGHKPPSGKHANVIGGSINSQDIADNTLTGGDIADRSGVDTCPPGLKRLGRICAESDSVSRGWFDAFDHCSSSGLRLPTPGEAVTMAQGFDVPGVPPTGLFWTDNEFFVNGGFNAVVVSEEGVLDNSSESQTNKTVCVAVPSA
jgi:hypothetical protein